MAYASVASLLQTIDLVNYHNNSSISISRFNDQIKSLHEHASFLQSFLEDDDPNRAKNWEETIREVADRAEEIIDLLVSDSLLKSSKSELDRGVDELEKVAEEMELTADRVKGRRIKAEAAPDEELMNIISLLREGSCNRETIAIVGMGGSGRSTLARKACNHPLVMEHFDVRAWATVSQEYSRTGIVLDLLRSINAVVSVSDEEEIHRLHKILYGKRYLIVLYDMWSVRDWDDVRWAFPDNRNGSRIILTTRLTNVANNAGHVHRKSLLSEDQSWNLLREKIFKGEPCPSQLEPMGKMIARSCGGHQLSIELVSGLLAADQTEPAWKDVSENIIILASEEDDVSSIIQIMNLCYTYLPHRLRPCFLYLGCFQDLQEIRVWKLIKLWVAEGFLKQSESKSFQETGEEYVEDLVRRSLVSVSKRKSNGRIKSITVHDTVEDMCRGEARAGNFIHEVRIFEISELQSCRRVCRLDYSHNIFQGFHASTIRTVIDDGEEGVGPAIGDVRLLRILDLSNARDYDLPGEVFQLFHLRYLAFHPKFSISKAISNLQNLQTLIICPRENGPMFHNLPEGIWRMPQLRHLYSFAFKLPTLKQGEAESSALENLETLSRAVDFVCSRENLKMIPNVKKLNIYYTKDVVEDIELHNLISLHKLEILKIEIEWSSFLEKHKMSFAFPPTLKKLNLCGLQLPWDDMKIVASLPNLEVLKLRNGACFGDSWETSERGFSRLTYLMIEECDPEDWITESSHFPRLKTLMLRSCLHLSKVPCEIGEIPTLQLIELDDQNQSLLNSAQQIQEDRRQSLGDDQLQILVLGLRNTIIDDDDEDDDDDDDQM